MQLTEDLRKLVDFATEQLKGSALRRFMAQVVRELGRGGQRRAQEQFGWSRDTIRKGEHELSTGVECIDGRCGSRASVDRHRFPGVDTLLLNQDNGPELHSRRTQFMARLVEMADTTQTTVRLAYYPPYHSKYNPAERPWAVLENEWNGDLLDTVDAAIGHARSMTWKGRHPTVVDWLSKTYEKAKKLGKEAMQAIEDRLERLPGLQKWFVDIAPLPA